MTTQEHLAELAEKMRSGCGALVGYNEVRQWPKGRLKELIGMGVLAKGMHAKRVTCTDCGQEECSGIEPTIETIKETGETAGFFLCLKGGGLKKIPKEELQQWVIVPEKLKELGYRTQPLEIPEDIFITPSDATQVLEVNKGTVSRMADRGELKDNGIKGAGRMISKISVYDYLEKQKLKQKADDYDDIMQDDKNLRKMR